MTAVGPTVIVESLRGAETAAVGAWVRSGSAHEPGELAGITHLIEHLLLRRCGRRAPESIAELIDSVGGGVDAFTTRELCAVTAHVPAERFTEALELVLDALFRPRFLAAEVALERQVVAAEFEMVQDSPSEVAAERVLEAAWGDHPLARPVLGRREVVQRLRAADLARFHRRRFTADELLLVAVSPASEEELREHLRDLPVGAGRKQPFEPPRWRGSVLLDERGGLEQVYVNMALPGLPSRHEEVLTLAVLHQLLGAGNSSRLFREIRDRRGLAYDVGSSLYSTASAGVLEVTFSAPVRNTMACWDAVLEILDSVAAGRIADREVELARQAIASGIILGTEGPDSLMEAHAGEFLGRGRRFDAGRLRRELDEITPDRVRALCREIVRLDMLAAAVCGPGEGLRVPDQVARRVA
jgi:predicted Zn-dependent peptidase